MLIQLLTVCFSVLFLSINQKEETNNTKAAKDVVIATCYGNSSCNACKNCKYCKHCAKDGGTCGVCR